MSVALAQVTAVRRRAASIIWPSPVWLRCMSAARVDSAEIVAVEKSTYGTLALDADDLGAEVPQQRPAVRAGDEPPEVDHPNPVQHPHGGPLRQVRHERTARARGSLRPSVASARVRLVAGASLAAATGGCVPA